jgi:hypothetical protein
VVHGHVELADAEFPEGAAVTVLLSNEETFQADPETERMLLLSITRCERGRAIPIEEVLGDLRNRE